MNQMYTCSNCGGVVFNTSSPVSYSGKICDCQNPSLPYKGQLIHQQSQTLQHRPYYIDEILSRLERIEQKLK